MTSSDSVRSSTLARSEEDDSDDSGVIKDVSKRHSVDDNNAITDTDAVPKPSSDISQNKSYTAGDLVWARAQNSTFFPCVVTNDPHYKFCTKIVKSDPGHHGGGTLSPNVEQRQYHVQYLVDNRRLWLNQSNIMPYKGTEHYERVACEDYQNINKYKPKTEAVRTAWRKAVEVAREFEDKSNQERLSECDKARILERGDKTQQNKYNKMEFDKQRKLSESDKSPEKFKSPSPRKSFESEENKSPSPRKNYESEENKTSNYRKKDELQYKMSRMSDHERKKRKSDENKKQKLEDSKSPLPFNVFDKSNTPVFDRSFKIKTVNKVKEENNHSNVESVSNTDLNGSSCDKSDSDNNGDKSSNSEIKGEMNVSSEIKEEKRSSSEIKGEEGLNSDATGEEPSFTEGSLVWAKQRGYPFWPAVITRDPKEGEFVKPPMSDSICKTQRKMHVLFLEYNNQRAWLPSSALQCYTGHAQHLELAAQAGPNRKKDFVPSKRYQAQFDKAIEFSESLIKLPDEDRLEAVFHKYGWVMVSEPGEESESEVRHKSKKRSISFCDLENKTTDSEIDSLSESNDITMHKVASSDRRSSAEKDTRLDPATDNDGSNSSSNKKKRESSLVASIAMNGDSSSDDNNASDSENHVSRKRKRSSTGADQSTPKQSKPKPNDNSIPVEKVTPAKAEPNKPVRPSDEEFPRLGDLVWGRMSGFPFWPSFVTKSPQGQYKKVGSNGKTNYHVQFFNWNDESGWVNAVLEFDGLDSFKSVAAKKKSDKSYNPAKGAMYTKWERAAKDAEETMDLTRSERLDCYLVTYGANNAKKLPAKLPPKNTVKKPTTPKPKKAVATSSVSSSSTSSSSTPRRTPGPASRTGLKASPSRATGGQLPAGWRIMDRKEGGQTFISPDGREFQDKSSAIRYISTCVSTSSNVQYLSDNTLPSGWRCQKIQNCIYYFSPRGERFESRSDIAARMESDGVSPDIINRVKKGGIKKRIGPKSVLKKIGFEILSDDGNDSSTSEDEDPVGIMRLPNKLKFRKGSRMDEYLDVDKLFDTSNGGVIEMVQLPDIFLGHPTVRVTESDNEMVISDVDTGEFIAKKIIYD